AAKDEAAGVAVGAWLAHRGRAVGHSESVLAAPLSSGALLPVAAAPSSVGFCRNRPMVERIALRKKNGIDTRPAMIAWITRLPAPGSMYAKTRCMITPRPMDRAARLREEWCPVYDARSDPAPGPIGLPPGTSRT